MERNMLRYILNMLPGAFHDRKAAMTPAVLFPSLNLGTLWFSSQGPISHCPEYKPAQAARSFSLAEIPHIVIPK